MQPTYQVTELLGDGIGEELSRAVHRLAEALPIDARSFAPVDLRLENRRANRKTIYDEAVEAVTATKVALKYPTTTAEESPNALLRRRLDLSVIHRPGLHHPRSSDQLPPRARPGHRPDRDRGDLRRSRPDDRRRRRRQPADRRARGPCWKRRGTPSTWPARPGKRVTSSSKYTIQKATDGLFERVATEVARQFPEVAHTTELFDALLGKVIMTPERFQIVLVLNEYGDFLSDMACGLAGSLGHRRQREPGVRRGGGRPRRALRRRPRHGTRHRRQEPGQPHRDLPGPLAAPLPGRRDHPGPDPQERDAGPPARGRPDARPGGP